MNARQEGGELVQVEARNDDGKQAPFLVEGRVGLVEGSYVTDSSYDIFADGKVPCADGISNVCTVRQVDGAGLEWHGSGKDVSIRRGCQHDRVNGETTAHFSEQLVASLRVYATHLRQLSQESEHGFGRGGDLLLLGRSGSEP